MKKIEGIITAVLTPYKQDESLDTASLGRLLKMNMDKGIGGFYVCGSTAEAFLLTLNERKQILEATMETAGGKKTVIAHVGCMSQNDAIELAKHAEKAGADAISSVAPFYYNYSFEEIKAYYFALADAVSLPVMIYNFPAYSGVNLTTDQLGEFLSDRRFAGVKHTSSNFYMLERLITRFPDKSFLNGYDEMLVSGLSAGACGGIGSTYGAMPSLYAQLYRLVRENRLEEARKVQASANDIIDILCKVGVIPGLKELLRHLGYDIGTCRRPFKRISAEESELLKKAAGMILNWEEEHGCKS